jgi:hypothetical protein
LAFRLYELGTPERNNLIQDRLADHDRKMLSDPIYRRRFTNLPIEDEHIIKRMEANERVTSVDFSDLDSIRRWDIMHNHTQFLSPEKETVAGGYSRYDNNNQRILAASNTRYINRGTNRSGKGNYVHTRNNSYY